MVTKNPLKLLGALSLVGLLAGCLNATPAPTAAAASFSFVTGTPTATATTTATVTASPSPTASASPTATATATATPTPTLTATPPPTPTPLPQRLLLPLGTTPTPLAGEIGPGEVSRYLIAAEAGQQLALQFVNSLGLKLVIYGADGTILVSDSANATQWQGRLPLSQDYVIELQSVGSTPTSYTLEISLSGAALAPDLPADRLALTPDSSSVLAEGTLQPGQTRRYVIAGEAGQALRAVFPTGLGIKLTLFGADGSVLVGEEAYANSWQGLLPKTQDYFLDVTSIAGVPVEYGLQVSMPPPPPPAASNSSPEAIRFPPGGSTAQVEGSLRPGETRSYIVEGQAGQEMWVRFQRGVAVKLVIYGADGVALLPAEANAASWQGRLPATQSYYLEVRGISAGAESYVLEVEVPPLPERAPLEAGGETRLEFGPDEASVRVGGSLQPEQVNRYVLALKAGQTLALRFLSGTGVNLVVTAADGSVLVPVEAKAVSWQGRLPTAQDYYIDVRSSAEMPTNYLLDVTILLEP